MQIIAIVGGLLAALIILTAVAEVVRCGVEALLLAAFPPESREP